MTSDLTHFVSGAGLAVAALWWVLWSLVAMHLNRTTVSSHKLWAFSYELCLIVASAVVILIWLLIGLPGNSLFLGCLSWQYAVGLGLTLGVLWWIILARRDQRASLIAHCRAPSLCDAAVSSLYALDAMGEEIVFRGLLLGGLTGLGLGPGWAVAISALAFGVMHVFVLGPAGVPGHIVFGLFLGTAFLLGGLLASIIAHVVYNILVIASRDNVHIAQDYLLNDKPTLGKDH
ncbi:CAAX amino terminal protease self- immunity [Actinomyces bovis]|uniref:CAAX amino terminal protease self- immunity n=1 Tax=Actinomyces bovis TaxID=1658 RepID=A0ABY1VL11_9ACTO|nr:CPBP family intramembrane glutamic endopeptidase [Actinomyces bovis]SPT52785.1 CAAX amino terminal protease self- immunity [Actinomyces bovis]VEG54813.1 CAAX amino terminal protease self- immunity [Actinomyces israelii]